MVRGIIRYVYVPVPLFFLCRNGGSSNVKSNDLMCQMKEYFLVLLNSFFFGLLRLLVQVRYKINKMNNKDKTPKTARLQ